MRSVIAPPPHTQRSLMRRGGGSTEASLGADELLLEGFGFAGGTGALVGDRHQPGDQEGGGHRDDGRVVVREDGLGIAEHLDPDGRGQDDQADGGNQAGDAAPQCAAGGQTLPVHGQDQHREVDRGSHTERQGDQEGHVLVLEQDAEDDGDAADGDGGDAGYLHFLGAGGRALLDHTGVEVVRDGQGAGQCQAGDDSQDGGEGDGREEAEEDVAANGLGEVHDRHVGAADQLAADLAAFEEGRVLADDDDGGDAEDHDDEEEEADEAGGVEHGLAGFLGVRHGEEAHHDVRQAGGTEQQGQRQRHGGDRVGHQLARRHDREARLVGGDGLGEQGVEGEVEAAEGEQHEHGAAAQQQAGLDDLDPGGGDHAAEGDVNHHQDADADDREVVVQPEQQLDQLAGADHLDDQVEADHGQRTDGGKGADAVLVEAVGGDVGEGELAQVAQALSHQEQDDRPADEEAHGVDEAIVALEVHHRGQTKQGRRRHVVASAGQAVLEAGDTAAGGVEVSRRLGLAGRPLGDAERGQHEDHEHGDGADIDRLLLDAFNGRSGQGELGDGEQDAGRQGRKGAFHWRASRRICSLRASNSLLARRM